MRVRIPSVAFVLMAIPLGAVASVSACGGDSSVGDAGPDATTDAKLDVAKLDAPVITDAGCANDVDLTQFLPSADGSSPIDAGDLTGQLAACTGCFEKSCNNLVTACNQDCDCRQDVVDFVTCIADGTGLTTCLGPAFAGTNGPFTNLIACGFKNCQNVCVPGAGGDGGTDGSTDGSANDGASDAAVDAPADGP